MMAKSLPLRTILRAAALFLLCAVCAMLPFFAFAVDDAGGEEHLWLITHADGTSEYSDDGIPFAAARDGDLFTALADVSMTTTAKVGTSASYTVDLRGRKISFNNGYGISGVDFYGSQRVTVLMEGAVFFSDVQMSIMFNVSDTAVMTFDGGEAGAVAYAPCFVNSIGNAQVSVNNLVFYKNSEHVKAAMCSRNNGLLELDRCAVYASGEKAPLYVNNTASIVMNASIAWSENGTVIYSDTDSGVRLTITGESLLFGSIVRVGRISAAPGARLSQLPTAATLEGGVCNALSTSVRVSYPTSVILGEVETVSRDLVFPYLIAPAVAGVAEQSERSVWARRYGDTVLYYETPYAPFMIPIADGVSFSLVRDLEVSFFPPLSAGSALSLDFSGQTLRIAPPVPTVESCAALLTYSGSFPITLDLRAATVVGASDTALLSAPAVTALTVRADDAVIIASRLFDCPQAEVLLEGGAYAVSSATAPALRARSLGMLNAQIVSYVASVPAVETAADLSMEGSRLFAIDSAGQALAAGGALALDRNSTVYGSVSAAKLSAENGAIFSSDLEVGYSDVFLLNRETSYTLLVFEEQDGGIVPRLYPLVFTRVASSALESVKVNLSIGQQTTLRVYIPYDAAIRSGSFAVRFSLAGIVHEAKRDADAVVSLPEGDYFVFSYRYVYHNNAGRSVKITIVSDGAVQALECPIRDLLLQSIEAAPEEERPAIATYAAFSFAASGCSGADEWLAPYAAYVGHDSGCEVEDERFADYIRSVVYDPAENTLFFAYTQSFRGKVSLSYRFAGREMTASADAAKIRDYGFSIPCYRIDPEEPLVFTFEEDGEEVEIRVGFRTFAAMTDGTISADLLDLYIAFLNTIA